MLTCMHACAQVASYLDSQRDKYVQSTATLIPYALNSIRSAHSPYTRVGLGQVQARLLRFLRVD
jgi:hypothetical protein